MTRMFRVLAAAAVFALAAPALAQDDPSGADPAAEDAATVDAIDAAAGDDDEITDDDGNGPYRMAYDKAVASLAQSYPDMPKAEVERVVIYMLGNTINTLFHEYGHGLVSELELPIVAKEEDAVDNLANIIMVSKTSDPALDKMLRAVADDYFTAGQFSEDSGDEATPWDEHSPDKARAYDVICILVGADPDSYKEAADKAGMPQERQDGCADEYESKLNAWDKLLSPYYLKDGESNAKVTVSYAKPAENEAAVGAMIKASGIMQVVTDEIVEMVKLPNPISASVETCGESNAYWSPSERKLTLCYEIVQSYYDNATENPPGDTQGGDEPADEPVGEDEAEPEDGSAPQ